MKRCFVCHGTENNVSEMGDGRTSHLICDTCRELVVVLFHIHGVLGIAVLEAAQAKRGSITSPAE